MSDEKKEETTEYIDPWVPKQRELIDSVLATSYAKLCDKISTYPTIIIPSGKTTEFMKELKTTHKFDMLKSHTCVDWGVEENIFELITLFFSTESLEHIWVSTKISRDNPVIDSLTSIWPIAEFQEREVYDLFGVQYAGNPDLRRIFLDDDWDGFPLKKDYQDDFMLKRP